MTRTGLRMALVAAALVAAACGDTATVDIEAAGDDTASESAPEVPDEISGGTTPADASQDDADHGDDDADHHDDDPAAEAGDWDRTIEVEMIDIAYDQTEFTVTVGETIRFLFVNNGEAVHEALIADEHIQDEHDEQMMAGEGHGSGSHDHGGSGMAVISLEPAESGALVFTFSEPGELIMGCHVPGHYAAGMLATIEVIEA